MDQVTGPMPRREDGWVLLPFIQVKSPSPEGRLADVEGLVGRRRSTVAAATGTVGAIGGSGTKSIGGARVTLGVGVGVGVGVKDQRGSGSRPPSRRRLPFPLLSSPLL